MIKEAISKATNKENLTREEALQVMKEIMSGEAEQTQDAANAAAVARIRMICQDRQGNRHNRTLRVLRHPL